MKFMNRKNTDVMREMRAWELEVGKSFKCLEMIQVFVFPGAVVVQTCICMYTSYVYISLTIPCQ